MLVYREHHRISKVQKVCILIFNRCLKLILKLIKWIVIFYIFVFILSWFIDGESAFTNQERIVHRLEKKAFPLIEKYHVTWLEESSKCQSIEYKEGLYTNALDCISIGFPAKLFDPAHLALYKKIRDVSLSNALWEHNFREARIEFDEGQKIKYGEFYFSHSYNELYIYSTPPEFKDKKTAQANGYIDIHWFFDKR